MNTIKKFLTILLATAMVFSMTGCKGKSDDTLAVTIDGKKLYYEDFLYDIYLVELQGSNYDQYYKETLQSDESYWDYVHDGKTVRELAKDTVMKRVIMYYILSDAAGKVDLSLSDSEISANEITADKFLASLSESQLANMKLTKDVVVKTLNRITLGDKYYQLLAEDIHVDEDAIKASIDADAFRQYKTEFIYISTISGFDSENNAISLTEDEIEANFKLMEQARDMVFDGKEMKDIPGEIPEITYNTHDYIYGDTTYRSPYQEASKNLENDGYTEIVQTGYGFLMIHMLDNNSFDAYKQEIADEIQKETETQFEAIYEQIQADYKIDINEIFWDTIVIGDITSSKEVQK